MRFSAPRSLKLAVNCRFSNFSQTSQPAMPDSVREWRVGVRTKAGNIRACASLMSAKVGAAVTIGCLSGRANLNAPHFAVNLTGRGGWATVTVR